METRHGRYRIAHSKYYFCGNIVGRRNQWASKATRMRALFVALFAIGVGAGAPTSAQTSEPRAVVPVSDLINGLKTIEVEIGGVKVTALFDTGAGISFVGKAVADEIGCEPFGQIAGTGMTGELVKVPWCGYLKVSAGGVEGRDAVGYFDNANILPEGWSIVSLNAFQDGPITLDWPNKQLILESEESLAERTKGLVASPLHLQRQIAGIALDAFFEVETGGEPLRIELDSGFGGGNILAPHAFVQLGLDTPEVTKEGEPAKPVSLDLTVAGRSMAGIEVHAEDIIYDGNFGAAFLSKNVVTLDFASQRIWIEPR